MNTFGIIYVLLKNIFQRMSFMESKNAQVTKKNTIIYPKLNKILNLF